MLDSYRKHILLVETNFMSGFYSIVIRYIKTTMWVVTGKQLSRREGRQLTDPLTK